MPNWKTYKDRGPWDFFPQPNKWGYLNNPRWLDIPRPFARGGPDDYDGRESEEPQIYTANGQPYKSTGAEKHHQCGHWHKAREAEFSELLELPGSIPCFENPRLTLHITNLEIPYKGPPDPDPLYKGARSLNEIGVYTDIGHTNLVPDTLITLPNGMESIAIEGFWWIKIPSALLTQPLYVFKHYIEPEYPSGIVTEYWDNASGGGGNVLNDMYHIVNPAKTLVDAYFSGYYKINDIKDGYLAGLNILDEARWVLDGWLKAPVWVVHGYVVQSVELFYGDPGTYGVPPFTPVPGTATSDPIWSINVEPNLLPYPAGVSVSDRYWLYIGVTFANAPDILYFPYGRISEPHPMLYFRWMGTIGGPDGLAVQVYVINEPDLFITCPKPSITFYADPSPITIGESTTLIWAVDYALTVSIDNGIGSVSPVSGSIVVNPVVDTLYTLTATGPGGTSYSYVNLHVAPLTTLAPTTVIPTTLAPTTTPSALGDAWAYWKMEETSGDRVDATGNGHDGTPTASGTGVVGYDTAKIGNGTTFLRGNGTAYLSISGSPTLTGNNHFVFAGWAKVASGGSNFNVLLVDGDIQIYLEKNGSNLDIEVFAGDRYAYYSGLSFDVLNFIFVYFDGIGLYVEVNDSLVASDLGNTNTSGFAYLNIGQTDTYTGLVTVDEFGVWLGGDADATITNRADLWNGGSGYSPY